jgi:hypothetical protein
VTRHRSDLTRGLWPVGNKSPHERFHARDIVDLKNKSPAFCGASSHEPLAASGQRHEGLPPSMDSVAQETRCVAVTDHRQIPFWDCGHTRLNFTHTIRGKILETDSTALNQSLRSSFCLSMIFSDLASPAEASSHTKFAARASRRRETGTHFSGHQGVHARL